MALLLPDKASAFLSKSEQAAMFQRAGNSWLPEQLQVHMKQGVSYCAWDQPNDKGKQMWIQSRTPAAAWAFLLWGSTKSTYSLDLGANFSTAGVLLYNLRYDGDEWE